MVHLGLASVPSQHESSSLAKHSFCIWAGTTVSERLTTPPPPPVRSGNVFDLQEGLKQWDGGVDSIERENQRLLLGTLFTSAISLNNNACSANETVANFVSLRGDTNSQAGQVTSGEEREFLEGTTTKQP